MAVSIAQARQFASLVYRGDFRAASKIFSAMIDGDFLPATITATAAEINARAAAASRFVIVPDATPYAVLAADSGKKHIIAEQAASITLNLPVHSVGLEYEFCMGGVATEAQNWVFVATTPSFLNGGVHWADLNSVASNTAVVYGNGTSHLTLTVVTPAAGSIIRAYAIAGGEWLLNCIVVSDTTPTIS